MSEALTSRSFATIRFEIVLRFSMKRPFPRLPADMREAEELERLRPPEATRLPVQGGMPSELDPVPEKPRQPRMIQAGEAVADIRVEHPIHVPLENPGRERIQRIMRAAPMTEPVGEPEEVRLIDGVQDLDDGTLEDLVLKRSDT